MFADDTIFGHLLPSSIKSNIRLYESRADTNAVSVTLGASFAQ